MSDDHDDLRDEPIGYGRPPRWSRFQKGQSGNPAGRPPRKRIQRLVDASATDDAARKELNRVLRYVEGGRTQTADVRTLLMKALSKNAIGGETNAIKVFLDQSRTLDLNDAERAKLAERQRAKDFATAKRYRDIRVREWAVAERNGGEPDEPWPHPDDIILDGGSQTWFVRGPLSKIDLPLFEYFRTERDAAVGEVLLSVCGSVDTPQFLLGLYTIAWIHWDRLLPLRWQFQPEYEERTLELLARPQLLRTWVETRRAEADGQRSVYQSSKVRRRTEREVEKYLKPLRRSAG